MPDKNKSLKTFITPKTDLKPNNIFDDYFKNPIPSTSISKKPITQQQNKIPDISTGIGAGTQTGSNDTILPEDKTIRSGAIRIVTPDTTPQVTQADDSDSRFLASLIGQGTAMLGAGIQGRSLSDVAEQFDYMRELDKRREYQKQQDEERKLQQKKAQEQLDELTNPNSSISKSKRLTYGKVFNIDIDPQYTASDLSDPVVLRALQQQSEEQRMARMPRGISVSTVAKTKTEKPIEIDKEDAKKISAMADLNYNIDNLINSIKAHGRKYFGEEAQNQDDLMYGIAASSGVLKGQGAMTESDIKFWQGVLAPSLTGSKEDYINRMKNKKNEYVTGITKSLENKGYTVKKVAEGKYLIFDKNENLVGQY
jgi:hypothetical protein